MHTRITLGAKFLPKQKILSFSTKFVRKEYCLSKEKINEHHHLLYML